MPSSLSRVQGQLYYNPLHQQTPLSMLASAASCNPSVATEPLTASNYNHHHSMAHHHHHHHPHYTHPHHWPAGSCSLAELSIGTAAVASHHMTANSPPKYTHAATSQLAYPPHSPPAANSPPTTPKINYTMELPHTGSPHSSHCSSSRTGSSGGSPTGSPVTFGSYPHYPTFPQQHQNMFQHAPAPQPQAEVTNGLWWPGHPVQDKQQQQQQVANPGYQLLAGSGIPTANPSSDALLQQFHHQHQLHLHRQNANIQHQMAAVQAFMQKTGGALPSTRRCRRCRCPNCQDPTSGGSTHAGVVGHKKKKQHLCHFHGCGKVYGKTSHLKAHLRWHSGERPFVCNWLFCGKSFTRSDELQRHLRTHTGEKRFACHECGKRFMRSDHLSKHAKTHEYTRQRQAGVGGDADIDIVNLPTGDVTSELSASLYDPTGGAAVGPSPLQLC